MSIRKLTEVCFTNKTALVRVDFNVPLDTDNNITNASRIIEALPTIKFLLQHAKKVILISHLGRPEAGKQSNALSLKPIASYLEKTNRC